MFIFYLLTHCSDARYPDWVVYSSKRTLRYVHSQRQPNTSSKSSLAIYAASELHQMRSPATALEFMASLVDSASSVSSAVGDVGLFGTYVARSWGGILRSSGIL
jgi:hypothetical protein